MEGAERGGEVGVGQGGNSTGDQCVNKVHPFVLPQGGKPITRNGSFG